MIRRPVAAGLAPLEVHLGKIERVNKHVEREPGCSRQIGHRGIRASIVHDPPPQRNPSSILSKITKESFSLLQPGTGTNCCKAATGLRDSPSEQLISFLRKPIQFRTEYILSLTLSVGQLTPFRMFCLSVGQCTPGASARKRSDSRWDHGQRSADNRTRLGTCAATIPAQTGRDEIFLDLPVHTSCTVVSFQQTLLGSDASQISPQPSPFVLPSLTSSSLRLLETRPMAEQRNWR
jgi:hypothetical protein